MSTAPEVQSEASEPNPRNPPLYRRPLVLIVAGALVAVLIIGGFVTAALLSAKPTAHSAAAAATSQPKKPSATPSATLTPTPTPTPTPSAAQAQAGAAAPAAPAAPVAPVQPAPAPAAITPTISNFGAGKQQTCSAPGATHISVVVNWTSTNGVRASLKTVSSYPAVSSHQPDTTITALSSVQGPINFTVPCTYAKVDYTLTLEYEANGAPQTYASATTELITTS